MRYLKNVFYGLLLLMLVTNACLAGDSVSDIQIDVKEFHLKNGMMFLIVERPATPQVACRLAIRAGSALEETGKSGIAHLLEHMMFKGTKNFGTLNPEKDRDLQKQIEAAYQIIYAEKQKRNPNQVLIRKKQAEMNALRTEVQKIYVSQAFSSQLGKNGAVGVNAFTTKDQTQYIMSVPADMLEQWFSIVSEQLFEPSWREFYVEKDIVQREWAFRYVNNPAGAAWLDLEATAYNAHPYRNPVIGWKSDMEKYSTQDAIAFHRKYYNPTNAVCVLVGDVKVEDAKRLARIYFERYPAGQRSPEVVTAEPPQQGPRKSIRYLRGIRTPLVRIGFHGARMGTKDFYALDVMTMILSQGHSARLTQNIVNKGLATEAWAYNPDSRYGSLVVLGGSPDEPEALQTNVVSEAEQRRTYLASCEKVEELLLAEVKKMKTEEVSQRELKRIKKLNQREFLDRMQSNGSLAGTLATLEVEVGWQYLTTYLNRIAAVTPQDIKEVAKKYFQSDVKTTVYIIPGGKPEKTQPTYTESRSVSGAAAAKFVRPDNFTNNSIYPTSSGWKHPLSFTRQPKKIKYPKAQITRLGNTTIFYLPDRELPLVDLTILVKAGKVDVSQAKTGLTKLLNSSLIRGGTENFSPSELARALDEDAIQLSVSVGGEESVIHLSVIKDDWEKGLAILTEILTRPAFDPEVLNVAKRQEITVLKRQADKPQTTAMREALIWHFKGHPYGRDPLLGLATIPNITGEDLKRFVKDYFVPSNMVVAVAGDITKQKALAELKTLFEQLPKDRAPKRNLTDPKETQPILTLINKPGQVQSQVILLLRSIKRTHSDYWKNSLLMNIFGGSDSLMYTRLRDDLGLVYSAGFYQTYKWNAGFLVGYIGCKSDKTRTAIVETLQIMKALQQEIPEKDLELKRLDALNSFVFNVDTPAELVEVYSRYHMRGEPLDTLERIQDAYINVSKSELRDLAVQLLDPVKIQIFIVGDKRTLVKSKDGGELALGEDLKVLAKTLDLPFREIELR